MTSYKQLSEMAHKEDTDTAAMSENEAMLILNGIVAPYEENCLCTGPTQPLLQEEMD